MPNSFQCPTCGAPLDVPTNVGATMRCPYCSNSVIIPGELRDGDNPEWIEVNLASLTGDSDKLQDMRTAMLAGNKIEAIKLFREMYDDVGLAEAKQHVEDLIDGKLIRLRRASPLVISTSSASMTGANPEQALRFQEALQAGNKIEAIKVFREITDQGLKESKDAVEAIMAGMNISTSAATGAAQAIPPQPKATRQVARSLGCLAVTLVLILALTVAGILFFVSQSTQVVSDSLIAISTEIVLPDIFEPTQDPSFAPLLRRVGKEGVCGGCFTDLRSVAQAPDGTIYAADYQGGRIQVFDAQGNFVTQWMTGDDGALTALAALRDGTVFVNQSGKLLHYQTDGSLIDEWLVNGEDGFDDAWPMTAGGLVAFRFSAGENDLSVFDNLGNLTLLIPEVFSTHADGSEMRGRVAADGLGNMYTLGTFKNLVLKYDSAGSFVNRFGGDGSDAGLFQAAEDIAVDQQGRIYVSDIKGIQVFDSTGRYIGLISDYGQVIFGLSINDQNELLAAARTHAGISRSCNCRRRGVLPVEICDGSGLLMFPE